ncbi:hypothetical protein K456DRAFT_1041378 [Colletotrichum gloeosporioides 23]|nr:hypothetical protein K456DRAFT_1041378 [Colletotrichum gloeosporioides 23]
MHSTSQALPRQILTTATTTTPRPSPTHQHYQHRVSHFCSHSATQPWQLQPVTAPYHSVHQSLPPADQGQVKTRADETPYTRRTRASGAFALQNIPQVLLPTARAYQTVSTHIAYVFRPLDCLFPAFHRHHTIRRTARHLTRATGGIAEPSQGGGGPPAPPLPCRRRRRPRHTPSTHHSRTGQDRTGQAAPVQLEQASIHASHRIHRHPSSPPCLRASEPTFDTGTIHTQVPVEPYPRLSSVPLLVRG